MLYAAVKKLLFLVGGVVFVCAVGCDEGDKSVKVKSNSTYPSTSGVVRQPHRLTNRQPGPTVSLPAIFAAAIADESAASAPLLRASVGTPSDPTETPPLLENSAPSMEPEVARRNNARLTRALIESRQIGSRLQDDLRRSAIIREIQKLEIRELKERLTQLDDNGDEPAESDPDQALREVGKTGNPTDILLEINREKRRTKRFKLQLQLAQLAQSTEKIEKLQKVNSELSHTLVEQAEEIKTRQEEQAALAGQVAELQKQAAGIRREMKHRVASLKKEVVEKNNLIAITKQIEQARAEQNEQVLRKQTQELKGQIALLNREMEQRAASLERLIAEKNSLIAARRACNSLHAQSPLSSRRASKLHALPGGKDLLKTQEFSAPRIKPIAGKISAVDELMIMVDIGKEAGLEEGMRLIAYRDDKFIGYLRVEEVSSSEAACSFTRKIIEPKTGDNVIDRLE